MLVNTEKGHSKASDRIPVIARPWVSEKAKKTLDLVRCLISELAVLP